MAIIFVPAAVSLVYFFQINRTFLKADFYKKSFAQTGFYDQIINKGLPLVLENMFKEKSDAEKMPISKTDLEAAIKQSVTPVWLKEQTEKILETVFAYIKGERQDVGLIIPINDIKSAIMQKSGLKSEKQEISKAIPEQFDFNKMIESNQMPLSSARIYYQRFELIFKILIIAVPFILILFVLLNLKDIAAFMRWLAVPFLISGILLLPPSLINLKTILSFIISKISLPPEVPRDTFDIIRDLAGVISNQFYRPIKFFSIGIIILSIIMLIVAGIIVRRRVKKVGLNVNQKVVAKR